MTKDSFFAVIVWSAPWKDRIEVRKMYDNECLSGIGWHSACEFETYRQAMQAARELRFAPPVTRPGASDYGLVQRGSVL